MTEREKKIRAAEERGYRRGRIEARAELIALYRERIHDATAILTKPLPLKTKSEDQ